MGSLSTGAVVGITAMVTGTLSLLVGFLAGIIVFYCISKHRFKSSSFKPEPSSKQQQQAISSSNPLQQTSPEYEEVVEMRKNTSYGELKKLERRAIISQHKPQSSEPGSLIEMRKNSSYSELKKLEMRAIISQHDP